MKRNVAAPKKVNRTGLKKISSLASPGSGPPVELATTPITDASSKEDVIKQQIVLECRIPGSVPLVAQMDQLSGIFGAISYADTILLGFVDGKIICKHSISGISTYEHPIINIHLDVADNSESAHHSTMKFLNEARQAVFTADYFSNEGIDSLLRRITELVIYANSTINDQGYLFEDKFIERVKLAKVLEKMSHINIINKTNELFMVYEDSNFYEVTPFQKTKAVDFMGGRYMDDKTYTGNFVINDIKFQDIEGRLKFTLDGAPVNVYIVDKPWIANFNQGEIKLAKNDRFKAVTKIERSPIDNKISAFYFVEILGINI